MATNPLGRWARGWQHRPNFMRLLARSPAKAADGPSTRLKPKQRLEVSASPAERIDLRKLPALVIYHLAGEGLRPFGYLLVLCGSLNVNTGRGRRTTLSATTAHQQPGQPGPSVRADHDQIDAPSFAIRRSHEQARR